MAQVKKDICLNSEKSSQSLGGIASEGNLQVVLYDNSNMQVFKYASGLWVNQWYGTSSKSIWLYAGGTAYKAVGGYYSGTSTLLTTVSNSKVDANTNELILEKAGKIRIKQTTFYPANSAIVYYKWDITNLSDTTINDFRMFSGGDTYLGGNDFGPGFWLPTENAVGVKKIIGNKMQKLEIPTWEELDEVSSNTSNKDFSSNSSNSSNSGVNEVNEVNEYKTHITTFEEPPIEYVKMGDRFK